MQCDAYLAQFSGPKAVTEMEHAEYTEWLISSVLLDERLVDVFSNHTFACCSNLPEMRTEMEPLLKKAMKILHESGIEETSARALAWHECNKISSSLKANMKTTR
jgi:hypothetical protein